jgi:ribosomal protein L13
VEGEMRTDYYFSVDAVWSAVEKTIADMKGRDVEPDKQADGGKIVAVINDEKVTFRVMYKDKDLSSLGIRVGLMGNETASKVIHDRVADNLLKK